MSRLIRVFPRITKATPQDDLARFGPPDLLDEAVRGTGLEPVRIATWCKPAARTKVETTGWKWASVNVIAFRKGKALDDCTASDLDHITEPPVMNGRRAELPARVAEWVVRPFAVPSSLMIDPFAGSGALVTAARECGMEALGFEKTPVTQG